MNDQLIGESRVHRVNDDNVLLWLRAIQLLVSTLNLFLNVYIMLSLDRFLMSYAMATMLASFVAQMAAIVGQFGYKSGRLLAAVYAVTAGALIGATVLLGQTGSNALVLASLAMTGATGLISGYVALKQ